MLGGYFSADGLGPSWGPRGGGTCSLPAVASPIHWVVGPSTPCTLIASPTSRIQAVYIIIHILLLQQN